jgi:hypothetical protein
MMGTDETGAASMSGTAQKPRGEASYVVQVQIDEVDNYPAWGDVVTVTVPAKTKRKTVVAKAVEQAGKDLTIVPGAHVVLRIIPAEHAEPIKVEMEQPPPQLKIG